MIKRNTTIDIIKLIAIFGVAVIHIGSRILTQIPIGSIEWSCGLFWGSLFRASVPLFLMCSGALMLNPNKKLSLKKLYFHNIARILAAMLFWGFMYKVYHLLAGNNFTLNNLIYDVKRLLLFDQEFHFYYIHIILLVYVLLPITRLIAEKADKKLLLYTLFVWFLGGIIYPTAINYYPFNLLSGMTGQWLINMTYASVGYGLVGYYLTVYPLSFKKSLMIFIGGFLIVFLSTFGLSVKAGSLNEMFLQGTSVGVCIMAIGIFSLARYIKPGDKMKKCISYISDASFCIYLTHMFVLYIMEKFGVTAFILPSAVSIPLLAIATICVCTGVYTVISKIPVINKWII